MTAAVAWALADFEPAPEPATTVTAPVVAPPAVAAFADALVDARADPELPDCASTVTVVVTVTFDKTPAEAPVKLELLFDPPALTVTALATALVVFAARPPGVKVAELIARTAEDVVAAAAFVPPVCSPPAETVTVAAPEADTASAVFVSLEEVYA